MPNGLVALVTGANKGIGLAVARHLGERGFAVRLGCRDQGRGEAAADKLRETGLDARAIALDVTDDASVARAAETLSAETGKLDVLVNNAGISGGGPRSSVLTDPLEAMRAIFEVNTFGAVRVTQAFLPLLRAAKGAKVIMVSSGLGSISEAIDPAGHYWAIDAAAYCASKAALNMFSVKFAKALLADGIKVNAIDPGYTATDLNAHTGPRSVDEAAQIVVEMATQSPIGPTGGFFNDGHTRRPARLDW